MDDGGGNGGGSFRVKHGSDAAEVTDVHEAGAGEVGDVLCLLLQWKTTDLSVDLSKAYLFPLTKSSFVLCFSCHHTSFLQGC